MRPHLRLDDLDEPPLAGEADTACEHSSPDELEAAGSITLERTGTILDARTTPAARQPVAAAQLSG